MHCCSVLTDSCASISKRYNGFIYASAHARDIDGRIYIADGPTPVDIPAGFEVAPGDASDIEVAGAHPWGSKCLIFSDGGYACSAEYILHPGLKGASIYRFVVFCENMYQKS
jgi:hypothetical protein